jgi:cytochrome c-type biogenesis protein CcmH
MITFWLAAALLSAATAGLVVYRAARGRRAETLAVEDPSAAIYRRQLAELDELSERGLLPEDERRSARAEAARRLLNVTAPPAGPVKASRGLVVTILAAATPLAALTIYLIVGSPQVPDQPYLKRVAAWRAVDPASLEPAQMVAVLQVVVAEHPNEAVPLFYLGRVQLAAGDAFSAERSLQKAIRIGPAKASYWIALGEAFVAEANGDVSADAQTAFARALALDPTAPGPRYYLARAKIVGGNVAGGLADWRALAQALSADDIRKAALLHDIDVVARTGVPPSEAPAAAGPAVGAEQQAFIRSMVEGLAARLKAQPDDPAGWGRLIRSYTVLGDTEALNAARAQAQKLFKDRPDALRTMQAAIGGGQ